MVHSENHDRDWRVKLVLHYDGRNFCGWQKQRNQRSVQGELESLLQQVCGAVLETTASGRTDRGVHASGQVASAVIPARFDEVELRRALNALAPADLWIESASRVELEFHPRYAVSRTYTYRVGVCPLSRSPFNTPWCWPLAKRPDPALLAQVTPVILGRHDFRAFAKAGQEKRGFECNVLSAAWGETNGEVGAEIVCFEITADRFLHHMVRYLVATIVDIGLGVRPPDDLERLLTGEAGPRPAAPAPPEGLFLTQVQYSWRHEQS